MGHLKAGKRKASFLLLSLLGLAPFTAAQSSDFANILMDTFLPQSAQLTGTQGIVFGVFLPVLLVWVLLYEGLRKADVFSKQASVVVSLIIALSLVPAGGYRLVSGFLFAIGGFFGFGAGSVGLPGVSYTLPPFISNMDTITRSMLASVIVGFITWMILNAGPTKEGKGGMWQIFGEGGIDGPEWFLVGLMMVATWFLFGGFSLTIAAIGWLLMFLTGFWLIQIYVEAQGGYIPALLALIGVIVLASLFRSMELFPEQIRNIANLIIQGAFGLIAILVILLVIAVYVVLFEWRPWE